MMRWGARLNFAAAIGAGLASLGMFAILRHEAALQWLLGAVAGSYSADGVISPAGVAIITRTVAVAAWLAGGFAAALLFVGTSLRRLHRSTPPSVAGPSGRTEAASRPIQTPWWSDRRAGWAAAVLLLAAAWLRIPRLSTSLWYDEIFSLQHFANLPWLHIPFAQEGFNNHILNSLFLRLMHQLSSAEALLRLPVFLAGVASLWGFWLIGRRLAGNLAGLLALWLAATSPYHLWYSTLARGYMLGLCFGLIGLWLVMTAASPPSRRSRWWFGATQVLAAWAMPTLIVIPLVLAALLLLGAWASGRRLTGLDPRTPAGRAWLVTSLWTVAAAGALNLPMVPFLARLLGEEGQLRLGASLGGAANWFRLPGQDPWWMAIGIGLLALGAWEVWRRCRWLAILFGTSSLLFLTVPVPGRVQVPAFAGCVILAALGLSRLVTAAASRLSRPVQGLSAAALGGCVMAAVTASSGPELASAARGTPFEDLRAAVRMAEAALPDDGVILTSGFTSEEIRYYASRPVRWVAAVEDAAALIGGGQSFCYFRLYGRPDSRDPVLGYFTASGPPRAVLAGGDDPIAVWCFSDGKAVAREASGGGEHAS